MKNFVILGFGRSGSNLLCDLLSSHPEIICHGELFHPERIQMSRWSELRGPIISGSLLEKRFVDPVFFLKQIKMLDSSEIFGFKFHHYQDSRVERIILESKTFAKVLLIRKNFLRRYLSERLSSLNDQYTNRKGFEESTYRTPTVAIDVEDFKRSHEYTVGYHRKLRERLKDHETHTICYEEFEHDFGRLKSLLRFLGASESSPLSTYHQRMNVRPVEEAIENYEELKDKAGELFTLDWEGER